MPSKRQKNSLLMNLGNSSKAALHDKWISAHATINWEAFSLGD